ncbi:MAG: enoyl-CoA hydratase/isomerase family protein [Microthrixaceae bacterium]
MDSDTTLVAAQHGPALEVVRSAGLVRLRLNRPGKLNALNAEICSALTEALADLERDAHTRVVVLEGSGPSFCAGADLAGGNVTETGSGWSARRWDQGRWQRVLEAFDRIPQATVASLHGHVIGGGSLLAAACDVRIAGDDSTMRIPELALGIPLTWGGIPLLAREVGLALTRDWVMSGREVGPQELLRSGFAQQVVEAEHLGATVDSYVEGLLSLAPPVLAMTRAMTSALGRGHPAMTAGWADADLLAASLAESALKNGENEPT